MNRKQEELGTHILENVRNELYYYFPYLDGAFACISGKGSEETRTIGTDGEFFLFSPEYLLELYVKKPEAVRRGYLHMLLHCLYLHLVPARRRFHRYDKLTALFHASAYHCQGMR